MAVAKNKKYSDMLKDPKWDAFRKKVFRRDGYTCLNCGHDKVEVHAHHTYYDLSIPPWAYPLSSVITLCKTCHELIHEEEKVLSKMLIDSINKSGVDKYGKCLIIAAFTVLAEKERSMNRIVNNLTIDAMVRAFFNPVFPIADDVYSNKIQTDRLEETDDEKLFKRVYSDALSIVTNG